MRCVCPLLSGVCPITHTHARACFITESLAEGAQRFNKTSTKLKNAMWWQDKKWCMCISFVFLCVIGIISKYLSVHTLWRGRGRGRASRALCGFDLTSRRRIRCCACALLRRTVPLLCVGTPYRGTSLLFVETQADTRGIRVMLGLCAVPLVFLQSLLPRFKPHFNPRTALVSAGQAGGCPRLPSARFSLYFSI